ncbi:ATP-binding protein [Endozoicomonadaceae bacterium StTr2]
MNRKLFWKLCISISLISMALVYLVSELSNRIESSMSQISDSDKHTLNEYRREAEVLVEAGNKEAIQQWLEQLQNKENTFATIIELHRTEYAALPHPDQRAVTVRLGRQLDWGLHLHHSKPMIELGLSDGIHYLVLLLPDHMMPGRYWGLTHTLLHLLLPFSLMMFVSLILYRNLMRPLGRLEKATREFTRGNYATRVSPDLNGRNDELGRLAQAFDEMASKIGSLLQTQRHLLNDLSHELRTPLQRIELCLETGEHKNGSRLKKEATQMRNLVEDTLTLAWLQNESPQLRHETVDLIGLLEAIADDTQFEYQDRHLELRIPDELLIYDSSEKALNMALENIIRNAMQHSPTGATVLITVSLRKDCCEIVVQDQGGGVPEDCLDMIFKPFFRVDKARGRDAGGFGLGLALARRQIKGVGGSIRAENVAGEGLRMQVRLPCQNSLKCKKC